MELLPGRGDVGDDVGDVAEDGAEGDEADEQLEDDEDDLGLGARRGEVADRGHGQDRPVHRLEVRLHGVALHGIVHLGEHAARVLGVVARSGR